MSLDILITKEGSTTLLDKQLDETYHSRLGVMVEADFVYLKTGLEPLIGKGIKEISVFEMGFGTGLNAWKSSIWAFENGIKVSYLSIDKHRLQKTIIENLNYKEWAKDNLNYCSWYDDIHRVDWDTWQDINSFFSIRKWQSDICVADFLPYENRFQVCFFDAFAPNKQPEVWSHSVLEKVNNILIRGGILTTYCSQGNFRRKLEVLGFEVYKIKGTHGKRHITYAIKV